MTRYFLPFCMLMLGCHVGRVVAVEARLPYRCQVYGCGPPEHQDPYVCDLETGQCNCGWGNSYNCLVYSSSECAPDLICDDDLVQEPYQQCSDPRPDACLCQAGLIGDDCGQNRLAINCDDVANENIGVTITPYDYTDGRPFAGRMFAFAYEYYDFYYDDENSPCVLEPGVETTIGLGSYDGVEDCGEWNIEGGEVYTYIYIQHHPLLRSVADHIIRASCLSEDSVLVEPDHFVFVDTPNLETLPPIESTITNSDGGFTVQLKMQTTPTAWVPLTEEVFPVEFGADLSLIVTHDTASFMVKEIVAQNMPFDTPEDSENLQRIKIMERWCVTTDGFPLVRIADIWQTGVVHEDGDGNNGAAASQNMFRIDFNAFLFSGYYAEVFFSVFVCYADCYDNSPPECTNQVTNYYDQESVLHSGKRKRRDVVDSGNSSENIAVSFQVITPKTASKKDAVSDGKPELSSCYKSMSVLLPMILLATLLVVAMIMSFFFCQKIYSVDSAKMKQSSAPHKA